MPLVMPETGGDRKRIRGMPRTRLRCGDFGGRRAAEAGMRADVVVILPPIGRDPPGVPERQEQRLVQAFVARATFRLSTKPFRIGLPGAAGPPVDPGSTAAPPRW